ncbi:MAG: hypothetical protein AAFQ98_22350 [Bacteroidota bacterium]
MEIIDAESAGGKSFTVLVNPTTYSVQHNTSYANQQPIGATSPSLKFNKIYPSSLWVEFLFDSTGSLGILSANVLEGVMNQIDAFMKMVYKPGEKAGTVAPRRLHLVWGALNFEGVCDYIDIAYSHFDAFGNPIRAKVTCSFMEDRKEPPKNTSGGSSGSLLKRISFNEEKHKVNGLLKYGSYLRLLQKQPYEQLPNSLRGATTGVALDLVTNG